MANAIALTESYTTSLLTYEHFDDFTTELDTTNEYTNTLTASGTSAVGNGEDGRLVLTTNAADNAENFIGLRNLTIAAGINKPVVCWGRFQYAEAATNAANVAVGLTSTVATGLLANDGAGLKTTGSHFAIYKIDGGTTWIVETRNGTAFTRSTTNVTAGSANMQTFEVIVSENPQVNTQMIAVYKVNGQILNDSSTGLPISHRIVHASLGALTPFVAVKSGSTTAEVLTVDLIGVAKSRAAT
jgi:hypothetical protein